MRYRPLIHFKNDEEWQGREWPTLSQAMNELLTYTEEDEEYDSQDVEFWQVEPADA